MFVFFFNPKHTKSRAIASKIIKSLIIYVFPILFVKILNNVFSQIRYQPLKTVKKIAKVREGEGGIEIKKNESFVFDIQLLRRWSFSVFSCKK